MQIQIAFEDKDSPGDKPFDNKRKKTPVEKADIKDEDVSFGRNIKWIEIDAEGM